MLCCRWHSVSPHEDSIAGKPGCPLLQEAWQAVTMPLYHRLRLRTSLRQQVESKGTN